MAGGASAGDLRLGIVGAGNMGRRLALASRTLRGVRISAVTDSDPGRGERLAGEVDAQLWPTADALTGSGDVDAIYVALPHGAHGAAVTGALRAGVHVLVEKPMADSEEEAVAMLAARDSSGAALMVGFSHRFTAGVRFAKERVAAGEIGEVTLASDLIVEGLEDSPSWYWGPDAGGVLQLQGHHSFDRLAWVTGSPIVEVSTTAPELRPTSGGTSVVSLRFASGLVGTVALGLRRGYRSEPLAQLVVQGSRGVVRVETWCSATVETAARRVVERYERDDWLVSELAEFVEAIGEGRPPMVSGEDGLAAVLVAAAARESADRRMPVAVKQVSGGQLGPLL